MRARLVGAGLVAVALVAATVTVVAVDLAPDPAGPQEARTPTRKVPVELGAEMFRGYCAPCHGVTGSGDGPAAAALRTRPTDLTRLAAANGGQFPAQKVAMVLEFGVVIPAHGSTDMPTWESVFRVMGDEATVRQRVSALTRYLESIQVR